MMGKRDLGYNGYYSDSNEIPHFPWGLAGTSGIEYVAGGHWSSSEEAAPVLVYDCRIANLEKDVRELREMLARVVPLNDPNFDESTIVLRNIPLEKAKEEIAAYFRENDGKEIGYEELIEGLGIEPEIVITACNDLEAEGKIG